MIDFENWQGAQWVLAFWLAMTVTFFPAIGLALKPPIKWAKWTGWYAGKLLDVACLSGVLAWGGFWA